MNYLYRELHNANQNLHALKGKVDDLSEERLSVYNSLKATVGLGDPTHPKNQERQVKGALKSVFGSSPKYGFVQRKLLSGTTDLVGRAVIIPDPDLDLDSAGIPEPLAWNVYKPFIYRRLIRRGASTLGAARAIDDRTKEAREALLHEMETRPVMLNRAPVLHRFGVMAFKPRLVDGDSLRINPFVTTGFGADFDGDQMNYSVPVSQEAVEELYTKMLPSRNLFHPASFKVHQVPSKEFAGGLYAASTFHDKDKPERVFESEKDAIAAYNRGEIDLDHPVKIIKH